MSRPGGAEYVYTAGRLCPSWGDKNVHQIDEHGYPGYKTIAKRMGVSDKTARRLAKTLGEKISGP